jgi:curved DNA-binding protein CbpA
MSGPASDPYVVLGVSRQASPSEIARAYRRAARATHPDSRPDDPSAAERFVNVSAAYEILGDPYRRAAHDRATAVTRVVVTRRPTTSAPPPVRLGGSRFAGGFGLGARPAPFGRPFQRGFLDRTAHGWRSPASADEELLEVAADLLRRLRTSGLFG